VEEEEEELLWMATAEEAVAAAEVTGVVVVVDPVESDRESVVQWASTDKSRTGEESIGAGSTTADVDDDDGGGGTGEQEAANEAGEAAEEDAEDDDELEDEEDDVNCIDEVVFAIKLFKLFWFSWFSAGEPIGGGRWCVGTSDECSDDATECKCEWFRWRWWWFWCNLVDKTAAAAAAAAAARWWSAEYEPEGREAVEVGAFGEDEGEGGGGQPVSPAALDPLVWLGMLVLSNWVVWLITEKWSAIVTQQHFTTIVDWFDSASLAVRERESGWGDTRFESVRKVRSKD
jgi:hypothetical protein